MSPRQTYRVHKSVIDSVCRTKGWEYKDLAVRADVAEKTITNAIKGERLSITTIALLASKMGIDCDDLIDDGNGTLREPTRRIPGTVPVDQLHPDTLSVDFELSVKVIGTITHPSEARSIKEIMTAIEEAIMSNRLPITFRTEIRTPPEDSNPGLSSSGPASPRLVEPIIIALVQGVSPGGTSFWAIVIETNNDFSSPGKKWWPEKVSLQFLAVYSVILCCGEGPVLPDWVKGQFPQLGFRSADGAALD
jgi:hypothetical protein